MTHVRVIIVNAFVDGGTGGNPAGVVLDAERFDPQTKQTIAAHTGLSETAFVSPSQIADCKLEFFTPTRQIAHCGHATIATFSYLAQIGRITGPTSSKETIDGTRAIFLRNDMAFMEQVAPAYSLPHASGIATDAIMASLGLDTRDVRTDLAPTVTHNGVNGLMIPLRDEATLCRIVPDFAAIERISEVLDLVEYYTFCFQTRVPGRTAAARMFAPRYGIPEEAATGMAAGALAGFLYDCAAVRQETMIIEQGHLMQPASPSELTVELRVDTARLTKVLVGGRALVTATRDIAL